MDGLVNRRRFVGLSRPATASGFVLSVLFFVTVAFNLSPAFYLFGRSATIYVVVFTATLLGSVVAYLNGGLIATWSLVFGASFPHYISSCSGTLAAAGVEASTSYVCPVELPWFFGFFEALPITLLVTVALGTSGYLLGRGLRAVTGSAKSV